MLDSFEEFEWWFQSTIDRESVLRSWINSVKEYLTSEIEFVSGINRGNLSNISDDEIIEYVDRLNNKHVNNLYMVYRAMDNEIGACELQSKTIKILINNW